MRRRFFTDNFGAKTAVLRGDTAEHLGRVLRAEPGQLYELSDGGRVWLARIEKVALSKRGGNRIEFILVEEIQQQQPALQIQLLMSVVKFDRLEWCLEKATELGVSEVVLLAAARSDKALLAAAGKRRARWDKILLESAQQTRRLRPPILRMGQDRARGPGVHQEIAPQEAFAQAGAACKLVLSERREAKLMRDALSVYAEPTASLAIGPEGGWTDDELDAARAAGFAEASLGQNILRTETAVLAALAILGFTLGD
ncbi:MAG TPA: RsmE family RNA methyltransferase [Candidatus Binatus sp.]|nr:RsmE family RNA methyltransferase [Candidatus Binatus sp.]